MIALLIAGAVSMAFTLLLMPLYIRLCKRLGWGQFIREDGPKVHYAKKGTAQMGGVVFITGSVLAYFVAMWCTSTKPTASGLLVLGLMVGLGLVGFLDDYLKTRRERSLGLGGWQKVFGQLLVGTIFALLALNFPNRQNLTPASVSISIFRDTAINLFTWGPVIGLALYLVWILTITTSTSNAVNVTDGADGLATGASILAIGSYVIMGYWQSNQLCNNAFHDSPNNCYMVRDPLDLAIVAAAVVGGLIGFLWWNTAPAKIFMGDSGSLALGGVVAGLAILSRTEVLLVLIGGIFVVNTASVIIQRLYFKATGGKRIFLMSPLHHHFELKGWAESTVVVRFWILQAIFVSLGVGLFYLEWNLTA